jgi:hypothetical protein
VTFGLAGILRALPGLVGVLTGIFLYAQPFGKLSFAAPCGVLLVLVVAFLFSYELFIIYPRVALFLLEPWVLSAVCIIALSTEVVLWLTVTSPSWFALDKSRLDAVTGALVGSITTYLATIWTKDIQDSKGPFLPATQFQFFLAPHFSNTYKLVGDTPVWHACNSDHVSAGLTGWGIKSRWRRAKILSDYRKSNP